ncbi:hypothetical protein JHD53_01830 [Peptacetobacter hiranonis]|uniref:hypothetical protein n=1 Tax=Peptacetobacter hiranonis TaxID=89152 RepID=UPI0019173181|nr:hypothetical protein [Peptacetobacter hiranonis]QQQ86860.1 hypothetical protein JHD53_01830 [Peptacetobacter hiranonis]
MKSKTMKKEVNLRMWLFFKSVPAILLFIYYALCTVNGYNPVFRYLHAVTLVLSIFLVYWQHSFEKKNCIFDEFGSENLKTTDSVCLKFAFMLMAIETLACIFADFNGILAGYFVVGGIVILTIIRATIFTIIDKKGM